MALANHKAMIAQTARKPMARIVQDSTGHNERSVQLPLERSVHAKTGSVLKARAKALGLSQRDLVRLSGLALGTVNAVLNDLSDSDDARRCLDETLLRQVALTLRFIGDLMEGIA